MVNPVRIPCLLIQHVLKDASSNGGHFADTFHQATMCTIIRIGKTEDSEEIGNQQNKEAMLTFSL